MSHDMRFPTRFYVRPARAQNQASMCHDPHLRLARSETGLGPSVKCFTDRFKVVLLLWIICVIYVLCLSCFCVCSLLPCGHLEGKG